MPHFPYNVNVIVKLARGSATSLHRGDIMTISELRVGIISLRVFRTSSTGPGQPLQSWSPGVTITHPLGYHTLLQYVGGAWVPVDNRNVTQAGLYKWSRV